MDGVDHLIGLLTLVKKSGWNHAFGDDVLYGRMDAESSDSHSYAEPLLSLRRALSDSKICMTTLNKVRDHLGKKMRSLKRTSTPLVLEDGIRRLPDKLLALIFKVGHLTSRGSAFSLLVSHVSSRFRQVALQTPLLWTSLSARYSIDLTRTFISRSGSLNLDVTYQTFPRKGDEFLTIVGALSCRWASLTITDMAVNIISAAGLTMLPSLRYLSHYLGNAELDGWSMPLLSHFEGYRLITQNHQHLAQLTHIELHFCEDHLDVPSLARAFYQARNLQDIKLGLDNCKFGQVSHPLDVAEIPPPLSLKINALKIVVSGNHSKSVVYNIIQPLHNALSYLLPMKIEIYLDRCPFETLYGKNGEFFPDGTSIRLRTAASCDMTDILAKLLRRCAIASSVHLEAPHASFILWPWELRYNWTSFPSLRHLSFRNCDRLAQEAAEKLANGFLPRGVNVSLQSLEFDGCKKISEEFLLNLRDEVGDKLKWVL